MDRPDQDTALNNLLDIEKVSVLLSNLIEREILGTREITDLRRSAVLGQEYIFNIDDNIEKVICGSKSEGINLMDSNVDFMFVEKHVHVMYPGQGVPPDRTQRTVLYVRKTDSRPGYVALQLVGHKCGSYHIYESLVPVGNDIFVSSDMYRELHVQIETTVQGIQHVTNGPSSTNGYVSTVRCFHFKSWPREATQWVTRPRLYGWPTQALIDKIVQSGCYLVPVGDKCCGDTLLQWRISFTSAERLLVHSFNHIQMKVYYLLKYFLKQIKPTLRNILGKEHENILCSYHLKTVMFFLVENSHLKLWQERNLFYCFWLCLNILISGVRAGHLPHYFIPTHNLFRRKVNGQNQRNLLHILERFHNKKLLCLLNVHRTHCRVDILECIFYAEVQTNLMREQTGQDLEYTQDMFLKRTLERQILPADDKDKYLTVIQSMHLLMKSQSEEDEALTFANTVSLVSELANTKAHQSLIAGHTNNKTRYQRVRKWQHRLTLCASMGTNVLDLATFHFLTGNYLKALQLCKQITSQPSYYIRPKTFLPETQEAMYMKQYCGRGYTASYKLRKTLTHEIRVCKEVLHLPHFRQEVSRNLTYGVLITPLPYAVFLSFLCRHELRDTPGRDLELLNMIRVKLDERQGGFWIVHTMLGICYETIGDFHRAISAYQDSASTKKEDYEHNPAMERISALRRLGAC